MNAEELIEKAIKELGEVKYEPHYPAYYVTLNGRDFGGEEFCHKCIDEEVKIQRKENKQARDKIKSDYNILLTKGIWNGKKIKEKYTPEQIAKSMRYKLKEFPAKAKFGYEGHDPDFGGGLTYPKTCDGCGEYFECYFQPDEEGMTMIEEDVTAELCDAMKWKLEIVFRGHRYAKDDIQLRIEKLAVAVCIKAGVLNSNFVFDRTKSEMANTA